MTDDLLKRLQARALMTSATGTDTPPALWFLDPELPRKLGVEIPDFRFPTAPVFLKSVMKTTPVDLEPQPKEALDWMTGTRFQVGDIVTRDGTDRQRVIEINDAGDLMLVECIKAPLGYFNEDSSRDKPWCDVGDQEWNLPRRYSYPEELVIEGASSPDQALK